MNDEIVSIRHETKQQQKIDEIEQTMHAYVQGNPEMPVFCFFLPSTQDLDEVKQAAVTTSLSTGKRIDLIYPTGITREEQE